MLGACNVFRSIGPVLLRDVLNKNGCQFGNEPGHIVIQSSDPENIRRCLNDINTLYETQKQQQLNVCNT